MNDNLIYLDHAATTPLDPSVFNAMLPYFGEYFGNTSSIHWHGQKAEAALEGARMVMADLTGAARNAIIFTSGGSESDNLALRGCARKQRLANKEHILISPVEHPAIGMTAAALASEDGFIVEYLRVDSNGIVDPDEVAKRIRSTTGIVSVIAAQNEIGSINPISEIARVCADKGVVFHSDAVQYAAHFPIQMTAYPVGMLSIGAHKFYGPKGVGVLIASDLESIIPTQTGGNQESGLRAGTHNTPLIVGMAKAYQLSCEIDTDFRNQLIQLRDTIIESILSNIPGCKLTGHTQQRLPNHASFIFEGLDSNILLVLLDQKGFCCSSGSACKTGNPKPSEILRAIGVPDNWAMGALRVSLGRGNTFSQVEQFLSLLPSLVSKARALSG